tara:strand:- start:280 stop:558 length:279 start_codon:yes stop_codon:yes gene_type:complete
MQEHNGIEGGNVDALGQAAGIGQDAAGVFASISIEPVQQRAASFGVEGAVDVLDFALEVVRGLVVVDQTVLTEVFIYHGGKFVTDQFSRVLK